MNMRMKNRLSDIGDGAVAIGVVAFLGWIYIGIPILVCYTIIKVVSMLI